MFFAYQKGLDISHIAFIKLDVEGFEITVLRGAYKSLFSLNFFKIRFCIKYLIYNPPYVGINVITFVVIILKKSALQPMLYNDINHVCMNVMCGMLHDVVMPCSVLANIIATAEVARFSSCEAPKRVRFFEICRRRSKHPHPGIYLSFHYFEKQRMVSMVMMVKVGYW